jgi:hypothetical protein
MISLNAPVIRPVLREMSLGDWLNRDVIKIDSLLQLIRSFYERSGVAWLFMLEQIYHIL